MTGPVTNYMRNLALPPMVQTRIINDTLSNSRGIQIMKGIGQRWHRRSVRIFAHGASISICTPGGVGRDAVNSLTALDMVGIGTGALVVGL